MSSQRLAPLRCLYCGEDEEVEVMEIWGREFMLSTCCEGMHQAATEFLNEDPKSAARWLGNLGLSQLIRSDASSSTPDAHISLNEAMQPLAGHRGGLRRVIEADGQLLLDWNLEVEPVPWKKVKTFVKDHHRHCDPPAGWRFGAGVLNGADLLGVVVVGRPVARALDHKRIVEVNRVCIREDLPAGLEWNACSKFYGWAAREAKRRGFEWIITYTLESEAGTSLKAAGWQEAGRTGTKGRSWSSPSRPRANKIVSEDKVRWYRQLVRNPVSSLWDVEPLAA
ncbi:hypothetical protein ABIC83_002488 [Roseateles asaccharophilus]|uniref:XF1762 family protein n=1 Tax=Roseateles asaccharophilus TaxID=582607 RepID=UPI003839993A